MAKLDTPWKAKVLTLFPEMFPGPLGLSLAGQGLEAGAWDLETVDIRDFAADKHRTVDDAPFGGGPGMVMRPDVVSDAIDAAASNMSDIEKFAVLGFGRGSGDTDVFDNMFQDKTIDPATGALLGRYIAEERDSIRMLAAENDRLVAKAKKGAARKSGAKKSSGKKRPGKK